MIYFFKNQTKIESESNTGNCKDDRWIETQVPLLGCVHFATESMQWMEAQNYCDHLLSGYYYELSHMVEIFTEEQHTYLREKVELFELIVGKIPWGIGLINIGSSLDYGSKWIWSFSGRTPEFEHWNGTVSTKHGFSAVMSSNEYDSSYNWNSVPMTYEFYPICQYLPYYTTTTRDPDPATTDIATCGKPCSSDSDCYGDCNLCLNYWQTPFCSWKW